MKRGGSHRFVDLTGSMFGQLTVIKKVERPEKKSNNTYWLCSCKCGREKIIDGVYLKSNKSTDCGCLKGRQDKFIDHGMSDTPEYRAWNAMINRCYNGRVRSNKYYASNGIQVCDRWRYSFIYFLEDVGLRPTDEHSLDRHPNRHGNYEPGNVRWATAEQQSRNRDYVRVVEYNGQERMLVALADEFNVDSNIVRGRLKMGWPIKKSLETAVIKKK